MNEALGAGDPFDPADEKNSFDFFVHPADGLNITLLVDRAGHGDVLAQRQSGKRRGERIDFRGAGAVAIDSGVRLLEADAGCERERLVLRKLASQVTSDDVHSFVMEAAAEIRLALDVDQAGFSESGGCPGWAPPVATRNTHVSRGLTARTLP